MLPGRDTVIAAWEQASQSVSLAKNLRRTNPIRTAMLGNLFGELDDRKKERRKRGRGEN